MNQFNPHPYPQTNQGFTLPPTLPSQGGFQQVSNFHPSTPGRLSRRAVKDAISQNLAFSEYEELEDCPQQLTHVHFNPNLGRGEVVKLPLTESVILVMQQQVRVQFWFCTGCSKLIVNKDYL